MKTIDRLSWIINIGALLVTTLGFCWNIYFERWPWLILSCFCLLLNVLAIYILYNKRYIRPVSWFVKESVFRSNGKYDRMSDSLKSLMNYGWGNGYVIIPPGHKLHGIPYDDMKLEAHGGLAFGAYAYELLKSDQWPEVTKEDKYGYVIGFDTAHYGDTLERWPKIAVECAAMELMGEVLKQYDDLTVKKMLLFIWHIFKSDIRKLTNTHLLEHKYMRWKVRWTLSRVAKATAAPELAVLNPKRNVFDWIKLFWRS